MAGRQSTGAAATAISSLVLKDRERRLTREEKRQYFQERLAAAGIAAGVKAGQISPSFGAQGQFQGFQPSQPAQGQGVDLPSLLSSGAQITQTIKTPQGTITIRHGGKQAANKTPYLTPSQEAPMLGAAQPGQPLPMMRPKLDQMGNEVGQLNNVPVSPAGVNTVNRSITQGRTESPAAQSLGQRLDLRSVPQGPFVDGPGGSFISGGPGAQVMPGYGVPRQQVVDQLFAQRGMGRQPTPQLAPTMSAPAPLLTPPTQAGMSAGNPALRQQGQAAQDPVQAKITQLLSQGVSPQRIAQDLRAKGIDPAQYGL